jgi:hypothetical protein
MTNRIAAALAIIILLFFAIDVLSSGGVASIFLLRKLADLVDYIDFWR